MDYAKLKQLNSQKKIAETFCLQDLVDGAREYEHFKQKLLTELKEKQEAILQLQKEEFNIHKQISDISFGGLLVGAIGIKMRDNFHGQE